MIGETCLIVPVPQAEPAVGDHRAHLDPSAADGSPAHITVLSPFLHVDSIGPAERGRLRELFDASDPVRFSLTRVARFPGVLYLAPEPSEPFARLTREVWRCWPECPPYQGAYEEVIPHLTVALGDEDFVAVERAVTPLLPVRAIADEVWLIVRAANGRWVRELAFPLSGSG